MKHRDIYQFSLSVYVLHRYLYFLSIFTFLIFTKYRVGILLTVSILFHSLSCRNQKGTYLLTISVPPCMQLVNDYTTKAQLQYSGSVIARDHNQGQRQAFVLIRAGHKVTPKHVKSKQNGLRRPCVMCIITSSCSHSIRYQVVTIY